jgi:glycosyltransferase involved in cell wall biosynthesis
MRILVITTILPWPEDEGARMRAGQTVRALTDVGDVDLYAIHGTHRTPPAAPVPDDLPLRRVRIRPRPVATRWAKRTWLRPGGPPRQVVGWNRSLQADLEAWADGPYDLAWIVRAAPPAATGLPSFCPAVVDLDDLEDQKAIERRDVATGRHAYELRVDAARWERWQRGLARRAVSVAVCSEQDRARVGYPNAIVIPNGYEPAGRVDRAPADPPRILLQGKLVRPPLFDAATVLASEILPSIRRRVPDTGLDLVGTADRRVHALAERDGVRVHGRVPSMGPYLSSAALVAVPMRWGSGTRIKILEAFAHGIPVVASAIGAEGLDVEDGRHLLIADDPDAFADACVRVLTDPRLAESLTTEARARYEDRYRWAPIRALVGEIARSVAAGERAATEGAA